LHTGAGWSAAAINSGYMAPDSYVIAKWDGGHVSHFTYTNGTGRMFYTSVGVSNAPEGRVIFEKGVSWVADMNGLVDNADPDFSVQGTWGIRSDNVVPGVHGKSFHYSAPGDGSDTAAWDAELVEGAGNYEVFVWYPVYSGLAANAHFTINHAGISDTLLSCQLSSVG